MVNLNYFVLLLEEAIGREAIKQFKSIEPGDVKSTCAILNYFCIGLDFVLVYR